MFEKRSSTGSTRPLPLKQRTSSLDTRRDYSHYTWTSLLVLLKVREYFVTVDHFSIWRRHLAWAMENGKDLRGYMTQRYSSNMVFMSLLLSTELGVLFNSATVTSNVRLALREGNHNELSFYAGFMIIVSALLTILSLISVFTAWSMVNSVDENNAHCIFRSSIGQYAAELPGRLIVCSIYAFLVSFILFFFLLLPVGIWSFLLLTIAMVGFIHIVSVFSAFGRVIMHTGAMGSARIFTPEYEEFLLPHTLHANLLKKAQANLSNNTSIIRQYRRKQNPIDRHLDEDEIYDHLCGINRDLEEAPYRPRADSTVRFADQDMEIPRPSSSSSSHFRTLTPLSDASSHRFTDEGSLAEQRTRQPTPPPPPISSTSSTIKKNIPPRPSLQSRPSLPSMSPFGKSNDSLRNVSTSSLEMWLQASPSASVGGGTRKNNPKSMPGPSTPRSLPQTRPKQPSTPGRTGSISSQQSGPSVLEITIPARTSDLSEEERFNLDYGDIDERPRGSSDEEYDVVEYLEDEERSSLLQRGGGPNNFYSSTSIDERPQQLSGKTSPKPPI